MLIVGSAVSKMESFFIITLLLSIVCPSLSEEYYVVAEGGVSCPNGLMCRDLNYYVNQSEVYFTSNTTLTFLQGTHALDQDSPVVIRGVTNITLQGLGVLEDGIDSTVVISCKNRPSGFFLRDFDNVVLLGLTIVDCGFRLTQPQINSIAQQFNISQYNFDYAISFEGSFSILLLNGVHTVIEDFSIHNSTGYGLATANVYDLEITSSIFSGNNFKCNYSLNIFSIVGGNIRLAYIDSTVCPRESGNVLMRNVSLSFGKNCGSNRVINDRKLFELAKTGGGLAVLTTSSKCGEVVFDFQDLDVFGNTGMIGSNIFVEGLAMTMRFDRITCSNGIGGFGGNGIVIYVTQSLSTEAAATELVISNSDFVDNRFGAGGIAAGFYLAVYASKFYDKVTLESCFFSENAAFSILTVAKYNDVTEQTLKLNLLDVRLYDNGVAISSGDGNFVGAIVLVNCECFARGLEVVNTYYTGIEMLSSTITFTGNNLIQNNTHTNGGGMVLLRRSRVLFRPPTVVSFLNNSADGYGGAMYIPQDIVESYVGPCFYQIDDPTQSTTPNVIIRAVNNSAGITGSFVSGGNLGQCYVVGTSPVSFVRQHLVSYKYLLTFIQPVVNSSDNYFISSAPVGVAMCQPNGSIDFNDLFITHPFEFYQGRSFNISIATISENQGLAPGTAIINVCNCTDFDTCLECYNNEDYIYNFTRTTMNRCTNISITLTGNMYTQSLAILLSTSNSVPYLFRYPLLLLLNSSNCPPGFSKYDICDCEEAISDIASCDIQSDTITTNNTVWIGYDNTSDCILYSDRCPEDFCRNNRNSTFNIIDSPDLQCANNRSGVLCGQCAEGYSLMLGSNECGLCPNDNHLSLLLVFGVAGVALVVLLIVLNLTVSMGTINGLVFYANIVKINEDRLFEYDPSKPYVLRQFISFINLDFGLPSCFYNGMTPYVKAWLQFVFPLYIWFIMIVIMLLSRQFTKLSKLIGNNVVKVFATLLLLSYTKIIRAIGVALASETVSCNNGEQHLLWRYDGNMNYGSTEHVILVVFALLLLLFLVLPYTLLLISIPFIARLFSLIRCRFLWIKPFVDAYAGPFQRTHQFWPGMLIVARILLTIIKNVVADDITSLYLTIFCVIFFLAIAIDLHGPYEKNYLNVLESWFLVNLLGLCVLGLRDSTVTVGSIVSVSLVLITFVGIIVLHLCWFFRDHFSKHFNKCRMEEGEESVVGVDKNKELIMSVNSDFTRSASPLQDSGNSEGSSGAVPTSVVKVSRRKATFSRYRDSILNSFDSRS